MIAKVNELRGDNYKESAQSHVPPTIQPVHVDFCAYKTSNLQHAGTLFFAIPSVIPSTAREVLIYAAVRSQSSN